MRPRHAQYERPVKRHAAEAPVVLERRLSIAAVSARVALPAGTVGISHRPPIRGLIDSGQQPCFIIRQHPIREQLTAADYIVRRLAREGTADWFGVAGDFVFN